MEDLVVEGSVLDIEKIRSLPGFQPVYHYPENELKTAHPCEYGKLEIGNNMFRFRIYSQDQKTRVLDCLGTVCHHLGMIRRQIAEGDDSVETDIYDLNRFVQQTMQAYV